MISYFSLLLICLLILDVIGEFPSYKMVDNFYAKTGMKNLIVRHCLTAIWLTQARARQFLGKIPFPIENLLSSISEYAKLLSDVGYVSSSLKDISENIVFFHNKRWSSYFNSHSDPYDGANLFAHPFSGGALADVPSSIKIPIAKSFRQHTRIPSSSSTDPTQFLPAAHAYVLVVATKPL